MKKIIIIIFFLISQISIAQKEYFKFTIDGFVNSENTEQNYVVLDFEGKAKEKIYNDFLTQITTIYVSAKDVVNKVDNKVITITAISDSAIEYGKKRVRRKYDLYFNIQFLFKDGKVRVNKPNILSLSYPGTSNLVVYLERNDMSLYPTIFNVDKTVRSQFSIDSLENFVNALIEEIVTLVKIAKEDW